jgi:DNA-directed RNA polymerase I, II, and III subunit RPABC2
MYIISIMVKKNIKAVKTIKTAKTKQKVISGIEQINTESTTINDIPKKAIEKISKRVQFQENSDDDDDELLIEMSRQKGKNIKSNIPDNDKDDTDNDTDDDTDVDIDDIEDIDEKIEGKIKGEEDDDENEEEPRVDEEPEVDEDDDFNDNNEIDDEDASSEKDDKENDDKDDIVDKDSDVDADYDGDACIYKNAQADDEDDDDEELTFDDDLNENVVDSKIIPKDKRTTKATLTKYERVRLILTRAPQLQLGAKPMIKNSEHMDSKAIAIEEIKQNVIPLIIERVLPNGYKEHWHISELDKGNMD